MSVNGILIWAKFDCIIRKKVKKELGELKIKTFKKGLVLPFFYLAYFLSPWVFLRK